MRSFALATLAITLALMAAPAVLAEATPSSIGDPGVSATATADLAGIVVIFHLPAPVQRFVFADMDVNRETWAVSTPGLTLTDGTVVSEQPFDTFSIRIHPDTAERDRTYIGLSRVGLGYVIYGPGLIGKDQPAILSFQTPAGDIALPARDAIKGYAYLGPEAQVVRQDQGSVVTGANTPDALSSQLTRDFFGALAFYGERLGPVSGHPTLVISADSPGPGLFRGDVTDSDVISLRFHGDWRSGLDQVGIFVWHEGFHLWNGHGVRTRDNETDPWLHEGGAEYAALVAAVSTGAITEDAVHTRLERGLKRCREALGDRDYEPRRLRSGGAPYDCGVVIQWLTDLEIRHDGRGDIFTLWQTLLDDALKDDRGYGVSDFRAMLPADSAALLMMDGPGAQRWDRIQTRLASLGVTFVDRPGDTDLRGAALFHVASRNCKSGPYGFSNTAAGLKLDGADCGPLSGEPVIMTVEDVDPVRGRDLFDAVRVRCAASLPVRYSTEDGRQINAVCDTPLASPVVWAIAQAPAVALSTKTVSTVTK